MVMVFLGIIPKKTLLSKAILYFLFSCQIILENATNHVLSILNVVITTSDHDECILVIIVLRDIRFLNISLKKLCRASAYNTLVLFSLIPTP